MKSSYDWYAILEACRRLASRHPNHFTSQDLVKEAGIRDSARSTALHIASAWCSKFKKWGYLIPVANIPGPGRHWNVWTVTDKGMARKRAMVTRVLGKPGRPRSVR